jgi:aldose 1-epimerase
MTRPDQQLRDAPQGARPSVLRESFAVTPDGHAVDAFTLTNARGMQVRFTAYGGTVLSIVVPDRDGRLADVTLGHDTLEGYEADDRYFGALIGRYANRIAHGRFTLDGVEHVLSTNEGAHQLHGGRRGFDRVVWEVAPFSGDAGAGAELRYTSADGEEGYPGTVHARVTYTLSDDDALRVDYHAVTDRATPVNLTHHAYFNLAGHAAGSILAHELTIPASHVTPVDAGLIPTGERRAVRGTPFDFTAATPIGARIAADDAQLALAGGYDHNFVLDRAPGDGPTLAARLRDPASGRTLEILTTEPGIQFYSGNRVDRGIVAKDGHAYRRHGGLALEPQHFPDSPNQPAFPSTILRPGEEYTSRTVYRFGVDAGPT